MALSFRVYLRFWSSYEKGAEQPALSYPTCNSRRYGLGVTSALPCPLSPGFLPLPLSPGFFLPGFFGVGFLGAGFSRRLVFSKFGLAEFPDAPTFLHPSHSPPRKGTDQSAAPFVQRSAITSWAWRASGTSPGR